MSDLVMEAMNEMARENRRNAASRKGARWAG